MRPKPSRNQALPTGWQAVRLGEVCSIDKESLSSKTPCDYAFEYISLSDVDRGKLIRTKKLKFSEAPSRARRVVKQGDVLLATVRPNLQGFYIFKDKVKDCIVSTGFAVLTPSPYLLESQYLFQLLFSRRMLKIYNAVNVGSNYPAINSSDIPNFSIFLPPPLEQKAIAFLLGKWDTAIEKTESLITAKRQYFGWLVFSEISKNKSPRIKLKDACKFVQGKKFKDGIAKESYLEIGDIDINMKSYNLSNKQKDPISGAVKVPKGTLLISTVRPTRGAITKTQTEIYVSQAFCRLEINNDFIYYCLHQPQFFGFLESRQSGGTYPTVSHRDIMDFKIPDVPPLQQNAIAHTLNTAQREIVLLEKLTEKYRTQKRGLMQKLLTGTWLLNPSLQRAKK